MTYYYKRIFPFQYFGFMGVVVISLGYSTVIKGNVAQAPFLFFPLAIAVIGYFSFKKLIFDLVDEVYDGGEFLLVKNREREARIQLSNIRTVSNTRWTNPERITLSLKRGGLFGTQIAFSPPWRPTFNLFQKNPIAEDLIARIKSQVDSSDGPSTD